MFVQFCQDFCKAYPTDAVCRQGYIDQCGGVSRLINTINFDVGSGSDPCWQYILNTKDANGFFEDDMKKRCNTAAGLEDPTCFGPQSYVCSTDTVGSTPLQQGYRYPWCDSVITTQCAPPPGYGGSMPDVCSCVAPFTDAQTRALSSVGISLNRRCIDVGDGMEQKCRQSGYDLHPNETCPNVCAVIQASPTRIPEREFKRTRNLIPSPIYRTWPIMHQTVWTMSIYHVVPTGK